MTPEDRELLLSLRRRQFELRQSLDRLETQLAGLESRLESVPAEVSLPPLPTDLHSHLPPLPLDWHETPATLPPLPVPPPSAAPFLPPIPSALLPRPSLEFRFSRWLTTLGAIFGLIALALIFSLPTVYRHLGAAGLLGLSAALSVGVILLGQRLERQGAALLVVGRTLMAMALAWLYLTAYAAGFDSHLQVISNPILAGLLLLLWSLYVLIWAERKNSQLLSIFAIALAYISTAINPVGRFTMAADLILAGTAVLFLLRNGWAAVSYLCLFGTYFAFLRRLVIDENGELALDTSRNLPFMPYAVYLAAAWFIFATAVGLCTAPSFRGLKRIIFVSLNNGGLAGLLALTTYLGGYEYGSIGWSLLASSAVFLAAALMTRISCADASDLAGAYLAQGLAVFTGGLLMVYTGVTRGVLLTVETFILGATASSFRSRILTICAYVSAFFATLFLIWEIAVNAHHPWLLGLGGAAVMLLNARWRRRAAHRNPRVRQEMVLGGSYFCACALGLIFTAMSTELSDSALPPELALAALILTFSIYLVPLLELPPLAQVFLLIAQALVLFPTETGEALPWWSTALVAVVTLVLIAWWPRQRVTQYGSWTQVLGFVYAFTLVGLTYHTVRPYADPQGWMISASLLSVAFLCFGAFTRVWSLALMGQAFLALAIYHFFFPPGAPHTYLWTWWAAAVPIAVVFAIGRATHQWVRVFPEIGKTQRHLLRSLAYGYQALALVMVIRWVLGLVPAGEQVATFLFLGTLLMGSSSTLRSRAWGPHEFSPFGVRASFVLSAAGVLLYLETFTHNAQATWLNGLAILCFLGQPALLRHVDKPFITRGESWGLILISAATGWFFISGWIAVRINPHDLTMGWAFYALFLFLFGLLVWEQRLRWCGLAVLAAAILRVFGYDFWGFSSGYRVLTFLVLAVIALGLGFFYARFGDRLKAWL